VVGLFRGVGLVEGEGHEKERLKGGQDVPQIVSDNMRSDQCAQINDGEKEGS